MLRHFLATLAYRGRKILSGLPAHIATQRPGDDVRTPVEILNHINGVLTFAYSQTGACESTRPPLCDWEVEVARFFEILGRLDVAMQEQPTRAEENAERLLQGPLADAMLHLGQIGIFRRLAGSPVAAEHYFSASIEAGRLADE
jgi:hypothetical protein